MNDPLPSNILTKQSTKNIKTVTLYSHSRGDDALGYLRLIEPSRKLGLKVIEGIEDDQIHIDRASEGDVVVLQRDLKPGKCKLLDHSDPDQIMSTVRVIIPFYNHENYVGECIQGVLYQTDQDFEIILAEIRNNRA